MRRNLSICTLGAILIAVVYAQTANDQFVLLDDYPYIQNNPPVNAGLTWRGFAWAFTAVHEGNWHPVTWLSHMTDCQLFGVHPGMHHLTSAGRHHLTSAGVHLVNSLLMFALLRYMTGRTWPSALVAALFALHPLHVESVAWIAQRKDVLSTFFGLCCIWTYVASTRGRGFTWPVLCTVFFALALMAKPMLVTLPFVLLLLDYWPLQRTGRVQSWWRLIVGKAHLFALAAVSIALTYTAQLTSVSRSSLSWQTIQSHGPNALVSYVRYLGKMIWPADLAALYVHPLGYGGQPWTGQQVSAAATFLLVVTVLCLAAFKRRYLVVGWLWYLGTLIPVIGLVQVGHQAMADRYTYLPLTGIFVMIAWGAADVVAAYGRRIKALGPALATVAVALVLACAAGSHAQVGYWKDSFTLFEHTLEVEPANPVIHILLGRAHQDQGNPQKAVEHYSAALIHRPNWGYAHALIAYQLLEMKKFDEAMTNFEQALEALTGTQNAKAQRLADKIRGRIASYRQLQRDQTQTTPKATRDESDPAPGPAQAKPR